MPIEKATIADITTIHNLAKTIWMAHYPPIIGEAQTLYMLDRMYSFDALKRQIESGELAFYLWIENEMTIAFAAIDHKSKAHGFLSKFYLDEKFRGKGIAQKFLAGLESIFLQNGKNRIELTVNRQNIGAINFYFKTGFRIERCEDFDIGNGYFMNDFVMSKNLSPN